MQFRLIIRNLAIMGGILGVAFASQQPWLSTNSKEYVYSATAKSGSGPVKNATDWVNTNILSKLQGSVSGGVEQGNNALHSASTELQNQKNNFFQNSFDSGKELVAKEVLDLLHVSPKDLGTCPAN